MIIGPVASVTSIRGDKYRRQTIESDLRWTTQGTRASITWESGRRRSERHGAVIRFEKVGLRYGERPEVLRGVNFDLSAGSFHFLTGPSGAGKSSLLKLIYLALHPTEGRIILFGRDVAKVPRRELPWLRRRIGVVFQNFRLLGHFSAIENVALPLLIKGAKRQEVETHVIELLRWVGLGERVAAYPATMSDGEKQRVAIARAVVGRPSVLLADEPTGNIDPDQAIRIVHLFEELNKLGTTVVIATHDQNLIARYNHHPVLHLERAAVRRHDPLSPVTALAAAAAGGVRSHD
ncbi:MAG: cell division ATP-binding protein FtsE [Alphaproteobacteria bacterium]|nr:cell division ATP-binding protein FtsE [Alphaproteobacteria bacterium]